MKEKTLITEKNNSKNNKKYVLNYSLISLLNSVNSLFHFYKALNLRFNY